MSKRASGSKFTRKPKPNIGNYLKISETLVTVCLPCCRMSESHTRAGTGGGWRCGQSTGRAPAGGRGRGGSRGAEQGHQSWEPRAPPRADTGGQTQGPGCKCPDTGWGRGMWGGPVWCWRRTGTGRWIKLNFSLFLLIFFWSIVSIGIFSVNHLRDTLIEIESENKICFIFGKVNSFLLIWPVFDSGRLILIFESFPLERNKIDLTELSDDFY